MGIGVLAILSISIGTVVSCSREVQQPGETTNSGTTQNGPTKVSLTTDETRYVYYKDGGLVIDPVTATLNVKDSSVQYNWYNLNLNSNGTYANNKIVVSNSNTLNFGSVFLASLPEISYYRCIIEYNNKTYESGVVTIKNYFTDYSAKLKNIMSSDASTLQTYLLTKPNSDQSYNLSYNYNIGNLTIPSGLTLKEISYYYISGNSVPIYTTTVNLNNGVGTNELTYSNMMSMFNNFSSSYDSSYSISSNLVIENSQNQILAESNSVPTKIIQLVVQPTFTTPYVGAYASKISAPGGDVIVSWVYDASWAKNYGGDDATVKYEYINIGTGKATNGNSEPWYTIQYSEGITQATGGPAYIPLSANSTLPGYGLRFLISAKNWTYFSSSNTSGSSSYTVDTGLLWSIKSYLS